MFSVIHTTNRGLPDPIVDVRHLFMANDFGTFGKPWKKRTYDDDRIFDQDGLPVIRKRYDE